MARLHVAIILLIAIFSLIVGFALATPPARPDDIIWSSESGHIGNPDGGSVVKSHYGGYVMAGEYSYAIGVDAYGTSLWSNSYAEGGYGRFYKAIPTLDGGYLFAGNKSTGWNGTTGDAYVAKAGLKGYAGDDRGRAGSAPLKIFDRTYNVSGCESWLKDGLQEIDGDFVFVGTARNVTGGSASSPGSSYIYVLKVAPEGDLLWSALYRGNGPTAGNGIVLSPDGGFAIAGTVRSDDSGVPRAYLLHIAENGSKLWDATYEGRGGSAANALCSTGDGYVLAGNTTAEGITSVYLCKVALDGGEQWNSSFNSSGTLNAVIASSQGGVVAVGDYHLPGEEGYAYIIKTLPDGSMDWARDFGEPGSGLTGVVQASNDSYVCGGYAKADDGRRKMWLVEVGMTEGPGYSPVCWCMPMLVLPAFAIGLAARIRRR